MKWSNVTRKLSELKPWERNPRQINEGQAARLKESFEEFGQIETIAIGPGNEVYNGHQRLNVLMAEHGGEYEVECRQSSRELTEKEREKLTVFLHKGAAGEWDWDILANEFEFEELVEWGFEEQELIGFEQEPKEAPEPKIDEAEELLEKWEVQSGQIWQLGDHRVICGDCTDKVVVDRLMGGETADMVITDPPYGMGLDTNYAPITGFNKAMKREIKGKNYDKVVGDDEEYNPEQILEYFSSVKEIFLWGADYYSRYIPSGGWFVWDKCVTEDGKISEAAESMIGSNFELCWSKKRHKRVIVRKYHRGFTSVDKSKRQHPTQKPIQLFEWFIEKFSNAEDVIADFYIGSGTAVLACEQLNRKCYGVEIEPKYVAVTIERWHEMTGETPLLLPN